MSGFFPVMMFGLPAACLAMYHCALPERRRAVGGLLGSIALTSILTGVTEPIEFTFMFLAPALYAVHALLTGAAFIIMNALHVRLGFGFSAGLFDYLLNFNRATRPLWLLPVGALYFGLYYGLFRLVILRFDLKTPGRDRSESIAAAPAAAGAGAWIAALGGAANLRSIDACTTRLRLTVVKQSAVDAEALKQLGARGLVRPTSEALQVVVGTIADQVAGEIRSALQTAAGVDPSAAVAQRQAISAPVAAALAAAAAAGPTSAHRPLASRAWGGDEQRLLAALGGRGNVRSVQSAASRLRVGVADAALVNRGALSALGVRGVAVPLAGCVHLIVGPAACEAAAALQRLLQPEPPG
jgi:PTS system N-acetylglucosamine-specific IIC component